MKPQFAAASTLHRNDDVQPEESESFDVTLSEEDLRDGDEEYEYEYEEEEAPPPPRPRVERTYDTSSEITDDIDLILGEPVVCHICWCFVVFKLFTYMCFLVVFSLLGRRLLRLCPTRWKTFHRRRRLIWIYRRRRQIGNHKYCLFNLYHFVPHFFDAIFHLRWINKQPRKSMCVGARKPWNKFNIRYKQTKDTDVR